MDEPDAPLEPAPVRSRTRSRATADFATPSRVLGPKRSAGRMAVVDFLCDSGNAVRDRNIDFAGNGSASPLGKQIHGARTRLVDDPY